MIDSSLLGVIITSVVAVVTAIIISVLALNHYK